MPNIQEKPRLVSTNRGFSVFYENRYLFSKYDPQKALSTLIKDTIILDNSLILCNSPVLPFCFELIQNKLKSENVENCFVLGVEANTELYNFFLEQDYSFCINSGLILLEKQNDIALLLENQYTGTYYKGGNFPLLSHVKRIIVLESSSNVNNYRDFYSKSIDLAQSSITQFWKNRATLMQLGKLFSKNVLKNVKKIEKSIVFPKKSITKPILVLGAGTSLDSVIPFIKQNAANIYILTIAASLRPLLDSGITPDGVVSVEAQYATERAFIGTKHKKIDLFADLVSRPGILNILEGERYFFLSEYTKSPLLKRIKDTFTTLPIIEPLGSVGLTCTELACMLRQDDTVPICTCGLDFSYIVGKSHCNESPHIKYALQHSNRFSPFGNVGGAFSYSAHRIEGKNHKNVVTDTALKGYGDLFDARFNNIHNLYDIADFGLQNSLKKLSLEELKNILDNYKNTSICNANKQKFNLDLINDFYSHEKQLLQTIRSILIGENQATEKELLDVINSCSYLYTHFPDGHKGASLRQDFLNRIRYEVDVFLSLF